MIWMAARWHLQDRWRQRGYDDSWGNGGVFERKKVLADFLFEYAAQMVRFLSNYALVLA